MRRWLGGIELAAIFLLGALSSLPARAQWPFSTPARAAATPFQGFDGTGPGASGAAAPGEPARDVPLVEKPFAQLSNQQLDDYGQKALAIRPADWKNAETDNFILHYRRDTEARKVAREVEYDLWYVAKSLGATPDQYRRKSHVFIFEDEKEWKTFVAETGAPPWAASFARGDELYLSLRHVSGSSDPFDSHILAHETTHAVVARLYPGQRWPLWLNEGFAEYMGSASVAARKGQSLQRNEHFLDFAAMSLDKVQELQKYPDDPVLVAELYQTSEKLIRFIMTALPKERFTRFAAAVNAGQKLPEALHAVYPDKLASYEDFQRRFEHFTK